MKHAVMSCALLLTLLGACSTADSPTQPAEPVPAASTGVATGFAAGVPFPQDELMPGEAVDEAGLVIAQRNAVVSALGLADHFQPGRDYLLSSGVTGTPGLAALLEAEAGELAWTVHRFPLGGESPGVLSIDANPRPGQQFSYYAAIADFSSERWVWQGPFSDSHVRLPLSPAAQQLSELGNAFCAVLCHDGAGLELVGTALSPLQAGDSQAPEQLSGLTAQARSGAAELQ